jgi:two-component system, LytTR family, sensor kinase
MHLEMKTQCEKCGSDLLPDGDAYICSYECTLCSDCALQMHGTCPNCGGELTHRPRRKASIEEDVRKSQLTPTSSERPWLIWVVSFGVWAFIALASSVAVYRYDIAAGTPMTFLSEIPLELSRVFTYAPLTPLAFALALRYPVRRRAWLRPSLVLLGGGIAFAVAHMILRGVTYPVWDWGARGFVSAVWDSQAHSLHIRPELFVRLFYANAIDDITGAYLPIVIVAHAVSYYRRFRDRELRASQLEGQVAKAHLQALKSQLQPHFLFNTMHSISALMLTDVRAADRMMTRLSDLLRISLENDGVQIITLNQELEFVTGYLEIEKVRFEDRLRVVFDVAPETLDALVPHLLLQPLVENAVRHGISKRSANGEIRVAVNQDGGSLYLRVRDNGPGIAEYRDSQTKTGLGLRATRERLHTLYGDEQNMEIRSAPGGGVEVELQIPFRSEPRPLMYETAHADSGPAA